MAEGGDFLQEWSHAVNEVYRKMGWNEQEEELILHCASDFLLFERKMVKEQLFFDANQLSQLYEKRIMKLGNECKLCRVLSFCAAAFLLIYGDGPTVRCSGNLALLPRPSPTRLPPT